MTSQKLSKRLPTDDLSMITHAISPKLKRLALGCEHGNIMIYDLETHERVGTLKAQKPDVLSLLFVTPERLIVGQVEGYIDIIKFVGNRAHITHSLQISEAGDINQLVDTGKERELMIGCAKGLLLC